MENPEKRRALLNGGRDENHCTPSRTLMGGLNPHRRGESRLVHESTHSPWMGEENPAKSSKNSPKMTQKLNRFEPAQYRNEIAHLHVRLHPSSICTFPWTN